MLFVLAGLGLTGMAVRFLIDGGIFHKFTPHFSGTCSSVDLAGATINDIAIDQNAGVAYLSVHNPNETDLKARLKRVNLKADALTAETALVSAPADFDPEGLAIITNAAGNRRMFAINHLHDNRYSVEMFDPAPDGAWTYTAMLRDTRYRDPGDLALVGPDQFYLANRSGAHNVVERIGEMLFGRGRGTLIYHDEQRNNVVVDEMPGSEGVAANRDGTTVYIGEVLARHIQVLKRDPYFGGLSQGYLINLPGAPRHIDVSPDGSLWIAASPQFSLEESAPSKPSPSQILHVKNAGTEIQDVREVYTDLGDHFSGATVAAAYGDKLLMGSPVESRLQICTMQ